LVVQCCRHVMSREAEVEKSAESLEIALLRVRYSLQIVPATRVRMPGARL
jgi:hypothetical protein